MDAGLVISKRKGSTLRLLVYPHDLSIGGSQINAIDLAAAAAEAGHDVIVYGRPGPLEGYIEKRGLRFIAAHRLKYRPAPTRIAQLAAIAKRERLDLVHTYEWPTCLDAYYGVSLVLGKPLLCTVLSMSVMPYVPKSVPLIMGTADLGEEARRTHRAPVWVLEPPIDADGDNPSIDGRPFRREHGVRDNEFLIVSVSRLAVDLKLDALVRAIDAADILAARHPVRLLLMGDGPAQASLQARAALVNARHKREVVSLPGATLDPRAAYAAADVVVAMGSSALRAMAIGRPLVVQGELGFSEVFAPETYELFLAQGFYGLANNAPGGDRLATQIEGLLRDPGRRAALGEFGRKVVTERFSLTRAAEVQLDIYRQVLAAQPHRRFGEAMHAAYLALSVEIANHDGRRKAERRRREELALTAARSEAWPPAGL
jgi:glycosyltransferase involved in cell wall biosynthesis